MTLPSRSASFAAITVKGANYVCPREGKDSPLHNLTRKRKKRKAEAFLCAFAFPALVSLGSQDLTAIVGTASLASSVGHDGLTALGANRNAGSAQLPVGATALIAAGLGHFTLRDSHGDTSLVKLLLTA